MAFVLKGLFSTTSINKTAGQGPIMLSPFNKLSTRNPLGNLSHAPVLVGLGEAIHRQFVSKSKL